MRADDIKKTAHAGGGREREKKGITITRKNEMQHKVEERGVRTRASNMNRSTVGVKKSEI